MENWIPAWAAGMVDADGSIQIRFRWSGRAAHPCFQLYVVVAQREDEENKPPPGIAALDLNFKGRITRQKHKPIPGYNRRSPMWAWYCASKRAETFIRQIYPYLVVKKDQAELVLKYRETAMGRGKFEVAVDFYEKLRIIHRYTKVHPKWEALGSVRVRSSARKEAV